MKNSGWHTTVLTGFLALLFPIYSFSQHEGSSSVDSLDKTLLNWQNKNLVLDGYPGTSVDKAYSEILSNKKPKQKIIVAVIDGGIDIGHDDLKGKIWTNEKEIPGNGIDDDHNGYVDDIHGWNFLGNSKGENINYETYESLRIKKKYDSLYAEIYSVNLVPEEERSNYLLYWACRKDYFDKHDKYSNIKTKIENFEDRLNTVNQVVGEYLGKKDFTKEEVYAIHPPNSRVKWAKKYLKELYRKGYTNQDLEDMKLEDSIQLKYILNPDFEPRKIISDNTDDISDKNYGNNDITGPDAFHGTFVSGIIGAIRDNNLGINGIADSVAIMAIRAIPDGDERDKDIALAIYYAVDNGARIINMSFGKNFSPGKKMVDDAILYAESKNVLVVHAAGNEGLDLDLNADYPSPVISDSLRVQNWIDVGASTNKKNKNLCASFSNYGKKRVDLFAPGNDMISLTTCNNYIVESGTSFACPVVSGIAALILSCYPEITAPELKEIIEKSCTVYPSLKVYIPNDDEEKRKKTKFGNLSRTAGIPDACKALRMADEYLKSKSGKK
jgi:subtilisin family serine protease